MSGVLRLGTRRSALARTQSSTVAEAITAPLLVLPQMLDYFATDQAAWLNASALLAGVMWAPLLGKCAERQGIGARFADDPPRHFDELAITVLPRKAAALGLAGIGNGARFFNPGLGHGYVPKVG